MNSPSADNTAVVFIDLSGLTLKSVRSIPQGELRRYAAGLAKCVALLDLLVPAHFQPVTDMQIGEEIIRL